MSENKEIVNTDNVQNQFRTAESFLKLVDDLNSERDIHELLSAVEGTGREVEESLPGEYQRLSHREIGWFYLLYEAHDETRKKAVIGGRP